jgi:hypothetical protein
VGVNAADEDEQDNDSHGEEHEPMAGLPFPFPWTDAYEEQAAGAWQRTRNSGLAVGAVLALHTSTTGNAAALVQWAAERFWHAVALSSFAGLSQAENTPDRYPDPQRLLVEQLFQTATEDYHTPRRPWWTHHAVLSALYQAGGDLTDGWRLFQAALVATYPSNPHLADELVHWAVEDAVSHFEFWERMERERSTVTDTTGWRKHPIDEALEAMHERMTPAELAAAVSA